MENKEFLDNLYDKYRNLQEQLQTLSKTIEMFGGIIPNSSINNNLSKSTDLSNYPKNGTWKDKILFTVSVLKRCYAQDILEYMSQHEATDKTKLLITINQYCYNMVKANELAFEKEGKKYKYFLKAN